jgi:hypothetical protein
MAGDAVACHLSAVVLIDDQLCDDVPDHQPMVRGATIENWLFTRLICAAAAHRCETA